MNFATINLKPALSVLLFIIFFLISSLQAEIKKLDNSIVGMWQAILHDNGTELILILDIKSTNTDSLECVIHLPEFGFSNMPYGRFLILNGSFKLPGFEAHYDEKAQKITGMFSALGPELSLVLSRISEKPLLKVECPQKEIDWHFKTNGAIWSSPTIYNGNILFGNDEGLLYSINIKNNSSNWTYKCEGPIRSKASIFKDHVYISSDDGYLYAINLITGESKWKINIGNDVAKRRIPSKDEYSYDYMCSSPAIHEGKIYIGSMDSSIYAIDAVKGDILWKFKTGGMVRSTPFVEDGIAYVGSWDNFMYALNIDEGSLVWRYDAGWVIQSSPIIADNKVIFGSRAAYIFAVDKRSGEEAWKIRFWGSWVESSPVLYEGIIYIGSSDYRKIHAINPNTGQALWGTRIEGWSWSTPAVNDNYVYTGSVGTLFYAEEMHGIFYAIDRNTGAYKWQVKVDDDPNTFTYGFAASPALGQEWVFFGGLDGTMYGIKEK